MNAAVAGLGALGGPLGRGEGRLRIERVDGASTLVTCAAASPLQVFAPRPRGRSVWVILGSHGGGFVGGDTTAIAVHVAAAATALVTTQAETKVYRAASGVGSAQHVTARVERGGSLALLVEPVSPFAGARHDQRQVFDLDPGASLLLVDGVVAGRTARGERWAFERYRTFNEVRAGGRVILGDALLLEPRGPGELEARLGRFDAFALVLALGPAFASCARSLTLAAEELPVAPRSGLLAAVSDVAGGVMVRCGSTSPEALGAFLRRTLGPAADALGTDALAHRW